MGIFSLNLIKLKYYALDKKSLLSEMVEFLYENSVINSYKEFFQSIMERENLMSTGIGKGVAIPHARSNIVTDFKIAIFILDNELDFDAIDDIPVKIIFMIAVPERMKKEYMKFLSLISNFFQNKENRNNLLKSQTKEEIINILKGINYEV